MVTNPNVQTLAKAIGRLMHGHPPPEPGSADWDAISRAIRGLQQRAGGGAADYIALAQEIVVLLTQRLVPTERLVPPRIPMASKRSKK
jgi:hypothetical protein